MKTIHGNKNTIRGQLVVIQDYQFKRILSFTVAILFIKFSIIAQSPDYTSPVISNQSSHSDDIETLFKKVSFENIKEEVISSFKLIGKERELFSIYLINLVRKDRIEFINQVGNGSLNTSNIDDYINAKKNSYTESYNDFLLIKDKLLLEASNKNNLPLAINGPCTNIDFENGTTSGWQIAEADACSNPTPCNPTYGGSSRIKITNKTMIDPYIPALSMVDPASGNYSVMLEDYINGANASVMRQTFQVTATNNVFTYRYAAVLEDPQKNHTDSERPYFKVRMFDQSGKEIKCASYTAIAKPPIENFQHVTVPNPNAGLNGGAPNLELYWRDWTSVSIPLLNYIGQNITVEFNVSDCALGAHLGYAYLDAACFSISPISPSTICGNQNVTLTASSGFAAYNWSGPGIVGSAATQSIKVNTAGTYTVKFTPFAENPCPTSLSVNVLEHCTPSSITASICEDTYGSKTASKIDLNKYNSQITAYHSPPGTVTEWHTAMPATNGNKISNPASVTIHDGDKLYAVIKYNVIGGDTAALVFKTNPKPSITFPAISNVCIGSPSFQINGVTPAGGTYTGSNVTASGTFNPSTAGTFQIKYTYTNNFGCVDTLSKPITVQPKPTVNAGPDQTVCSIINNITLQGTATNTTGVLWSNGQGSFTPIDNIKSTYTPTLSEKNSSTITLTITANGLAPCLAVSDDVKINLVPIPTVDAGPAQTQCSTKPTFTLNGSSSNSTTTTWSGGNGTFSNKNIANPTYTFSSDEINSGSVTLTYSVASTSLSCPGNTDQVVLNITKTPTVDAGPAQTLCENIKDVTLTGTSSNSTGITWSGGSGVFTSATALNTKYTPSPTEISSGSIILKLTASANSPCLAVTDDVKINFISMPTVNAGLPQKLCADINSVSLSGSATHFSSLMWSGGNGSFSSQVNSNTSYIPTNDEKKSGSVLLTLTASGITPCPASSGKVNITFIQPTTADAGLPQTLCESAQSVSLRGDATNYSSVNWTGGTGTFINANTLTPTYSPTDLEKFSGFVILKLTSNANDPCSAVNDEVKITFDPLPKVQTSDEVTVCGNNAKASLTGTLTNATSGIWKGGMGTYLPSPNELNISYIPTSEEIIKGNVTITLISIKNSTCDPDSSPVNINITSPPVVDAGNPNSVCINKPTVHLNGSVTGAASFEWSSLGNGSFDPDNKTLSTNYIISDSDLNKVTTLRLTAFAPLCLPVSDDVKIKTLPLPIVDLGPDKTECEGTSITVSTNPITKATYLWSKNKSLLSETTNSITIVSSGIDVNYYIEVTDSNSCQNKDSIIIHGMPMPVVELNDVAVCEGETAILIGNILNYMDLQKYKVEITWQKNGKALTNYYNSLNTKDAGNYTFTVNSGNCKTSDQAKVVLNPLPVLHLNNLYTLCEDDTSGVIIDAGPGFKYQWYPVNDTNQIIHTRTPGTYSVTVTNQFNCSTSSKTLVRDICPPRLFIGDAFSPDNDGVNDDYNVYGAHIGKFHMLIFNRWGEIIFESFDRRNAWNGIYRDELMPIGVYPWTITYEGDSEEFKGPYKLDGSVTVVR